MKEVTKKVVGIDAIIKALNTKIVGAKATACGGLTLKTAQSLCDAKNAEEQEKVAGKFVPGENGMVPMPVMKVWTIAEFHDTYITKGIVRDAINLFVTLDAINALNVHESTYVKDVYEVSDYKIVSALKPFVKEAAIVAFSTQKTFYRPFDYLDDSFKFVDTDVEFDFTPKVLNPKEFENAQFAIANALNYKCTELALSAVSRVDKVVSESIAFSYPVLDEENGVMAVAPDGLFHFPLKMELIPGRYRKVEDADYAAIYRNFWNAFISGANVKESLEKNVE